jgi:hypothetical protein
MTDITPTTIHLNIGADHGVPANLTLHVFRSEEPYHDETPIGELQVSRIYKNHSQAQARHVDVPFERGWRVRETGPACPGKAGMP